MATGFIFDEDFTKHDSPGHPECANRLWAILSYLSDAQLLPRLTAFSARPATKDELRWCHQPNYIDFVERISQQGGGMLDGDTYSNEYSYDAALKAAGGAIDLALAVIDGKLKNGFALGRPPGHHALSHRAMGFCIFGTIALAAKAAIHVGGLERVAIVDFDVHHGNGTQALLDDDPNIMFISSHQYPFYPGSGQLTEIGQGKAKGTKINIPLEAGVGDDGFKQLYSEVVFPALRRFQPQLLLISAGFDAHWDDPLANLELTLTGYRWLCQQFVELAAELCDNKIVFVLEGGYNLEVLAAGVGNSFRILLGDLEYDDPIGHRPRPKPDVSDLVMMLKNIHQLP